MALTGNFKDNNDMFMTQCEIDAIPSLYDVDKDEIKRLKKKYQKEVDALLERIFKDRFTGKWIEWWPDDNADIFTEEDRLWKCSVCGNLWYEKTNYCPNCGSKMRCDAAKL